MCAHNGHFSGLARYVQQSRPFSNHGSLIQQFRAENLTSPGKEGRLPVLECRAGGFELSSRPCGEICADEGIV